MGDVLQFRKPGTRAFPNAVAKELYGLSCDIRELQIGQRKYMAQGRDIPKSHAAQLGKTQSRMRKLLKDHCTKGSAEDAQLALTVHGCLNHRDVALIKDESIGRMRIDLEQILVRLFLLSYLPPPDCERVKIIHAYLPQVEVRINEQLIADAG